MFRWLKKDYYKLTNKPKKYSVLFKDNTPSRDHWTYFRNDFYFLDEAFLQAASKSLNSRYADNWKITDKKTGKSLIEIKFEKHQRAGEPLYQIWWKDNDTMTTCLN